MSLIKTGGGVAAISGKTGGTVYARNKAGAYSRNWAKPINPGRTRQTDVRSAFAAGSAAYSLLTLPQVAAWDAYASTLTRVNRQGDSYTPTGRQIFIEAYNNNTAAGEAILTAPSEFSNVPAINTAGAMLFETTTGNITTLTLGACTVTIPSGDAGVLLIEASPAHKASLRNVNTSFRQILFAVPSGTHNLLSAYTAVFGTSGASGQVIDLRLRVIDPLSGLGSTRMLVSAQGEEA